MLDIQDFLQNTVVEARKKSSAQDGNFSVNFYYVAGNNSIVVINNLHDLKYRSESSVELAEKFLYYAVRSTTLVHDYQDSETLLSQLLEHQTKIENLIEEAREKLAETTITLLFEFSQNQKKCEEAHLFGHFNGVGWKQTFSRQRVKFT